MKSYASVDRIEKDFAVCEVELIETEESLTIEGFDKETIMLDIPLQQFSETIEEVQEGDIFVVEHDGKQVTAILYKDEKEKQRRIAIIQEMLGE